MGKGIFKVDDNGQERFLVWSSIVDAPVTFACTAEQVVAMFGEEARERAEVEAQAMIVLARERGTSNRLGVTLAGVSGEGANRAGPDESSLTEDEIIEFYVRRKKEPTAKALAEYRSSGHVVPIGGSSPALRVPCSMCGAAAGAYCRRPDGSNQIIAHKKRREAEETSR